MAAALARQTPKAANMAKQVFKNTPNIIYNLGLMSQLSDTTFHIMEPTRKLQ